MFLLMLVACSPEKPAPPPPAMPPPATPIATASAPAPVPTTTGASYDQAMDWFRSTNGFRFTLTESGVHAEGEMQRKTVGAEVVELRANGEEWRASAGPQGIAWERKSGAAWKSADPPSWGIRFYQRATLAFDPQKKEGSAQLAGSDATTNHYRFTNANTGEMHDVWVRKADGRIVRMKIGDAVEMVISE